MLGDESQALRIECRPIRLDFQYEYNISEKYGNYFVYITMKEYLN